MSWQMIRAGSEIKNVAFVGSGKVANGLASIFYKANIKITGISSRNKITGKALALTVDAPFYDTINDLHADLVIVAVADKFVIEVVSKFPESQLVAFTAGSVFLNDLNATQNRAVFYPLQSFTEGRQLNIDQVPILLESTSFFLDNLLYSFCENAGFDSRYCDSETRKKIHLSAVFLNNFVNHLVYISQEEAIKNNLDWSLFQPLLNETFEKLKIVSPYEAQTGPAKRNDRLIIENHLSYLEGRNKEIYKLLSQNIIETYSKND